MKFSPAAVVSFVALFLSAQANPITPNDSSLVTRNPVGAPECRISTPGYTGGVFINYAQDNIDYLTSLGGNLIVVDSHTASRVACSYRAGIFVVNNSPSALSIAPNYMAVLAQNVIDFCGYEPPFVNGQQADEQDYVVIVADADC